MSALQIRQRLEAILEFMLPHWEFVNCHMVSYLTDNHWEQHVPADLRREVPNAQRVRQCIDSVFWNTANDKNNAAKYFSAFLQHLSLSKKLHLENCPEVLTTVEQLNQILGKAESGSKMSIKEFMSEKKRHEVEITAELVNDLVQSHLTENSEHEVFVVDAGDGKGYLSSRLALEYKHKVLGIDCKESNTENALQRGKKLQRAWNGLTERAELESKGITPPRRGKKQKSSLNNAKTRTELMENYKTTAKFITTDLNIVQLVADFFPAIDTTKVQPYTALCITGLHTCGNLAPTCLQVFHAQPHCRLLCNIGCCYHLLKEAYSEREYFGNKTLMDMQTDAGFPMSQFLQKKRIWLGRNARMLAAQSIERTVAGKELPNVSLFYRALLEVLICEQNPLLKDTVQVGKIRKFENFNEYVELCAKKSEFNIDALSSARIDEIVMKHADDNCYLDLFYLLRMSFAPVLEALILLDRLLYLKELHYEYSYLISVFDAVISPRHFGIIALKR